MHTPWGPSQSQETLAPGLVRVDTAGHGGYHVSEKRWQEIETMFPAFRSWTGRHWLEEDCDWALAPLTWPDLFSSQSIFDALRSAGSRSDGCVDAAFYALQCINKIIDGAACSNTNDGVVFKMT